MDLKTVAIPISRVNPQCISTATNPNLYHHEKDAAHSELSWIRIVNWVVRKVCFQSNHIPQSAICV